MLGIGRRPRLIEEPAAARARDGEKSDYPKQIPTSPAHEAGSLQHRCQEKITDCRGLIAKVSPENSHVSGQASIGCNCVTPDTLYGTLTPWTRNRSPRVSRRKKLRKNRTGHPRSAPQR